MKQVQAVRPLMVPAGAVSALVLIALGYLGGALTPANAFFAAILLVLTFTGWHLSRREGMTLTGALKTMFAVPASHPGRAVGYAAYLTCTVAGLAIAVQAALTA